MRRGRPGGSGGFVTLLVLGVVCLGLFTLYVEEGENGPLHTVQLGAAEVLRPARDAVSYATLPFEAAGDGISGVFSEDEEAERLREQARENQELAARASSLARENARLKELLEGDKASYEYASLARVIAPVSGQFNERVRLNVGSEDGIEPYMPVVVGERTLVGRTTSQITDHTAEVMLITDPSFAAGVRIEPPPESSSSGETTAPGETTASRETNLGEGLLEMALDGYLSVEFVELGADVEKGDFVLTSGRRGGRELIYPPGLLAGTVESVSAQDVDQYQKIVVNPAADLEDLQEVRVIVDW